MLRSGVSSARSKAKKVEIARTLVDATTKKQNGSMIMTVYLLIEDTKGKDNLIHEIDFLPIEMIASMVAPTFAEVVIMVPVLPTGLMTVTTE